MTPSELDAKLTMLNVHRDCMLKSIEYFDSAGYTNIVTPLATAVKLINATIEANKARCEHRLSLTRKHDDNDWYCGTCGVKVDTPNVNKHPRVGLPTDIFYAPVYDSYGVETNSEVGEPFIIVDGLPSFDAAIAAWNMLCEFEDN